MSLPVCIISCAASVPFFFRFGIGVQSFYRAGFIFVLVHASAQDVRTITVRRSDLLAGLVWWLLWKAYPGSSFPDRVMDGIIGGVAISGLLEAVADIFQKMTGKCGIGNADVTMFFITGLYLGFRLNVLNLILASVAGIAAAFIAGFREKKARNDLIPFIPEIALSTYALMLFCL